MGEGVWDWMRKYSTKEQHTPTARNVGRDDGQQEFEVRTSVLARPTGSASQLSGAGANESSGL